MKTKRAVTIICIVLVLVLVVSLVITAIGGAFAASQSQIDALQQQQNAIEEQKKELSGKIGSLENEMSTVMEKKEALDAQNELARQEIEIINEQIALYEDLIEKKAEELEEAKAVEAEQKEALRVRMRNMEEKGSLSYISILFKSSSFTDLLSRLDALSMIMKRDKEVEDAYIAAREHVEEVKAEYEATLAEQEVKKAELEEKKAQLEIEIAAASKLISDLESDIEKYRAEEDAAEAQMAALGSQINEMIAQLERQQAESGENVVVGTGTYIWPLPGIYPTSNTYGNRFHPIFHEWRFHAGTDIGANSGTPIIAADSGTVAVATSGGGYGNYVVINHSNGRSTLYAHMSSIAVSYGQSVNQGDTIGYVGSTGWSTGPHLHFEVRVNGVTTDPMSYFSF